MQFFIVRLQESKKQKNNFVNFFFIVVIEDSKEEEIKSNINTHFGSVKYFDNVNKIDSFTDCFELRFRDRKYCNIQIMAV